MWRGHLAPRSHEKWLTFVFCQAHTLIAVDEVPAGGSIQARGRQALVGFFLTVEPMVTWGTERKGCCQMHPIRSYVLPIDKEGNRVFSRSYGARQQGLKGLGSLGVNGNVTIEKFSFSHFFSVVPKERRNDPLSPTYWPPPYDPKALGIGKVSHQRCQLWPRGTSESSSVSCR